MLEQNTMGGRITINEDPRILRMEAEIQCLKENLSALRKVVREHNRGSLPQRLEISTTARRLDRIEKALESLPVDERLNSPSYIASEYVYNLVGFNFIEKISVRINELSGKIENLDGSPAPLRAFREFKINPNVSVEVAIDAFISQNFSKEFKSITAECKIPGKRNKIVRVVS